MAPAREVTGFRFGGGIVSKVVTMPKEPGFEVKSECGRRWFVPITAVQADYAAFLGQVDGLEPDAAMARAGKSQGDLHSWFVEQFDWADVDRYGVLSKEASAKDIARALNAARAGHDPGNCSTAVGLKAEGAVA